MKKLKNKSFFFFCSALKAGEWNDKRKGMKVKNKKIYKERSAIKMEKKNKKIKWGGEGQWISRNGVTQIRVCCWGAREICCGPGEESRELAARSSGVRAHPYMYICIVVAVYIYVKDGKRTRTKRTK